MQAQLGHADAAMTLNVYTQIVPESQRRAIENLEGLLKQSIYDHDLGQLLTLTVLRRGSKVNLRLKVVEEPEQTVSFVNSELHGIGK